MAELKRAGFLLCACWLSIQPFCWAQDSFDFPPSRVGAGDKLTVQPLLLADATPAASGPSLEDLGFSQSQTQGSESEQALLDKRSHMLKIHQRLGLITTIPLLATVFLAPGDHSTASQRDIHAGVAMLTVTLYFTTASYALRAPKPPETKDRGPIRLHKALAWIHFPSMILTPILGEMAYAQESRGEKVHGIASYHGTVASLTVASYLASILSVSINWGGGN